MSETPNRAPAAAPSSQALGGERNTAVRRQRRDPGAGDEHSALDGDQRRRCVLGRLAVGRPRGDADDPESHRRHEYPQPLPPAEPEAEESFREDGEEHQPAGQDGLDDGERRQSERGQVKRPGGKRDSPADREPLRAEEVRSTSQRVADLHGRREDGAAVLQQEADAGRGRAGEGKCEPGDHALTVSAT